ncbi:DUF2726 domain-containing protein [Agarivorans gilvus]|nr:DUF2726 domain-containing protein [Agarivorans gilvus]
MNLRLLNKYEEVTYDRLTRVCEERAKVFTKVRLADIFSINNSGISRDEFSYCLKAHFDFVIVDEDYQPIFAVEYDGIQHKTEVRQVKNDLLKNNLCKKFELPILRANFNYVSKKFKGLDLLTYFIECWFLYEDFQVAQSQGVISCYEDFDPCSFITGGSNTGQKFPYWISLDSQLAIQQFYKLGKIRQQVPSDWVGIDEKGNYRCITWLEVSEDEVIYLITGMQKQNFDCISISETIRMINIVDLHQALKECFDNNKKNVLLIGQFQILLGRFTSSFEPRGSTIAGRITAKVL